MSSNFSLSRYFASQAVSAGPEIIAQAEPYAAGAFIRNQKGEMLFLMDDRAPFWVCGGGCVEKGESFEQTFRREIAEELNTSVRIDREIGDFYIRKEDGRILQEKWYFCSLDESQPEPTLGNEGAMIDWFSEVPLTLHPFQRYVYSIAQAAQENAIDQVSCVLPKVIEDYGRAPFAQTLATWPREQITHLDEWRGVRSRKLADNPAKYIYTPWRGLYL